MPFTFGVPASWTCCCPTPGPAVHRDGRTTPCFPRKAQGSCRLFPLGNPAPLPPWVAAPRFSHQDGPPGHAQQPPIMSRGPAAATLLAELRPSPYRAGPLIVTSAPFCPRSCVFPGRQLALSFPPPLSPSRRPLGGHVRGLVAPGRADRESRALVLCRRSRRSLEVSKARWNSSPNSCQGYILPMMR